MTDITAIVTKTVTQLVDEVKNHVAKQVTELIRAEFTAQLTGAAKSEAAPRNGRSKQPAQPKAAASHSRSTIERWVPDIHARRVPKFVIEMTGMDLKKDIVQKYGDDAVFILGEAPPKAL